MDYLKLSSQQNTNVCLKAVEDAKNLHGKEVGHFFLGFLCGPFAIIGTAVANPTPINGKSTYFLSENKELFSDPEYLLCYKRKAKGKLISMEILGFATWAVLSLVIR